MSEDLEAILENGPPEQAVLETDPLQEDELPEPPGQPVVVIQYRTRGLPWYLVLPLLILVPLGAVAFYHNLMRSRARMGPGPVTPASPVPVNAGAEIAAAKPVPANPFDTGAGLLAPPFGALPGPLSLNTQPLPRNLLEPRATPVPAAAAKEEKPKPAPTPAAVVKNDSGPAARAAATEPARKAAPTPPSPMLGEGPGDRSRVTSAVKETPGRDQQGPLAVGFSVPTDMDNPFSVFPISRGTAGQKPSEPPFDDLALNRPASRPAANQPVPTKDQVFDEIQAEAAEKKAEMKELRGLKDRARDEVAAEAIERLEEQRVEFRQQLADIVGSGSLTKGKEIDELCNRFGRVYDPAIKKRVGYVLSHLTGKMSLQTKVKVLRKLGVPEPGVLDFLANELHRSLYSRNGPKDTNDVRLSAARQLLSMRLVRNPETSSPDRQAQQARP
jgi:hypothetical protein